LIQNNISQTIPLVAYIMSDLVNEARHFWARSDQKGRKILADVWSDTGWQNAF